MRLVLGVLVLALAAAGAAVALAWPHARLGGDPSALARLRVSGMGSRITRLTARDPHGRPVAVVLRGGRIWPRVRVPAGEAIAVSATVRRPSFVGWLVGRERTERLVVTTPAAHLLGHWLEVPAGSPVTVSFDRPVARVAYGPRGHLRAQTPDRPLRSVAVGPAPGANSAGRVEVAAVPRSWERLPAATRVTWFSAGPVAKALVSPRPGTLAPGAPLRLTFSRPLAQVLGGKLPSLAPATPGSWRRLDAHTLEFVPQGYGFGLGTDVRLSLPGPVQVVGAAGAPTRTLRWTIPPGSVLRLHELLAELGYLPLGWTPAGAPAAATPVAQEAAALDPPAGTFSWAYPNLPPSLVALWNPAASNVVTQGAVMAFESGHGLAADGVAGPQVWRALLADAVAHRTSAAGYSYVVVRKSLPQTLMLWHDGQVVLSGPTNTGIPQAPTPEGTFPVYSRLSTQTMSGTNPDGSHYSDAGIRWISYFHGGDAIHGFDRTSYGSPQSLGCVELPVTTAARVWPYTPIGTLVTVSA